jgi:hypothetical protein
MPFYKIIVKVKGGKTTSGIRLLDEPSVERAWQLMEARAQESYGSNMEDFRLVMLSKRDREVTRFIKAQARKQSPPAAKPGTGQ